MARSWTDDQLIQAHKSARSVRSIVTALGLAINGGNGATVKRHLNRLGLIIPHVTAKPRNQLVKEHRLRYPERMKANFKAYQVKNLDKFAQYARNRRAQQAQAEGAFSLQEFYDLCKSTGDLCLKCGTTERKLTPDHIRPISKGGSNYISNIQPLCGPCNSSKNAKEIDYRSSAI